MGTSHLELYQFAPEIQDLRAEFHSRDSVSLFHVYLHKTLNPKPKYQKLVCRDRILKIPGFMIFPKCR